MNFTKIESLSQAKRRLIYQELSEDIESFDPSHAIRTIDNLKFIVSFGEGYWASALYEYTMIYNPADERYYWVYLNYDSDRFEIRNIPKNNIIFNLLRDFNPRAQFDALNRYFDDDYRNLTQVDITALGFTDITNEQFMNEVWWNIAPYLEDTRGTLEEYVNHQKNGVVAPVQQQAQTQPTRNTEHKLFSVRYSDLHDTIVSDNILFHRDKTQHEYEALLKEAVRAVGDETLINEIEEYLITRHDFKLLPVIGKNTRGKMR